MRRLLKFGTVSSSVLILVVIGSLGANVWTYQRFTAEQPIAELSFVQLGPREYRASLALPDGSRHQFGLSGDSWQLDARIIKWHGWLTWLGRAPLYRLERISGRYQRIEEERAEPRSVHELSGNPGIDLWRLAREYEDWLPAVDSNYGSAVYLPMRDGARYRVTLSATGLLARPVQAGGS